MEISADFSTDSERMEQWSSTAKLRRLEVERIEALLIEHRSGDGKEGALKSFIHLVEFVDQ